MVYGQSFEGQLRLVPTDPGSEDNVKALIVSFCNSSSNICVDKFVFKSTSSVQGLWGLLIALDHTRLNLQVVFET